MDAATLIFEEHRSHLLGLAYRMLGSLADAQDLVQDTYLKWTREDLSQIKNPRSWLVTTCSRQALDLMKSARLRRETYCGVWLPEPYHQVEERNPAEQSAIDETVSMALMLALEKLSPGERAAFLLHEVFACSFDEIANILGKTSPACRKLASRARSLIQASKPRFQATTEEHQRLLATFLKAAYAGDLEGLKTLLAESVEMRSDGGGKAEAAPQILCGADTVARFMVAVLHHRPAAHQDSKIIATRFNGAPGVAIFESGRLVTALNLAIDGGVIHRVFAVRNPDKLADMSLRL